MCIRGPAKSQMTFYLQTILVQDQIFHLSNHYNFKYDPTPRLLGIILDEKIKVYTHIMHVERKANNSIHIIREIKGLANISRTKLLRIYNSLVRTSLVLVTPRIFLLISGSGNGWIHVFNGGRHGVHIFPSQQRKWCTALNEGLS
jgi:hypothetical protein